MFGMSTSLGDVVFWSTTNMFYCAVESDDVADTRHRGHKVDVQRGASNEYL